jgi:H+-transporting ATPase
MLLFMIFSILVFNLYPVTAFTIVLLALLNEAAILSVARDRRRSPDEPCAWNLQAVRRHS